MLKYDSKLLFCILDPSYNQVKHCFKCKPTLYSQEGKYLILLPHHTSPTLLLFLRPFVCVNALQFSCLLLKFPFQLNQENMVIFFPSRSFFDSRDKYEIGLMLFKLLWAAMKINASHTLQCTLMLNHAPYFPLLCIEVRIS